MPLARDLRGADQRLAPRPSPLRRGELVQLGLAEARLEPLFARDVARAAEGEASVDLALELVRAARTLGIAARPLAHPVTPEAHVRELVGEHEVDGLRQHLVARRLSEIDQLPERVPGEPLETAVHARDSQHRIVVTRRLEQNVFSGYSPTAPPARSSSFS